MSRKKRAFYRSSFVADSLALLTMFSFADFPNPSTEIFFSAFLIRSCTLATLLTVFVA